MAFSVVFIHGPAASGKHTIGSLVSKRLGLPLLHNHLTVDLVKTLFEFGTEPFIKLRASIWRETFKAACESRRSFIFTFNPENTVEPALIDELVSYIDNAGGVVHYVELICADREIIQRIGNESRRKFGKLTDASIYKEFKKAGGFEFPPFPTPVISVDTEVTDAEIAAEKIVQVLPE
jgi:hypothetical protein